MTSQVETALITAAIIGIIFLVLFVVAGVGSVESSVGHFFKGPLQGTPLEQSATSVESAGNGLTSWANGALVFFTGMLVILGLMYVGTKSKS
jgi:hypothetical protein